MLDPLDKRLKQLASPIYVDAIRRSSETWTRFASEGDELVADGYSAQS
jgi:hypothetical protein